MSGPPYPPGQPPQYPQGGASPYWYGPPPDHPQATTAMVLGILAVALCQILGPFAWVMGHRALREIDASQGRIGGRSKAQAGYILGIVATVLLVLGALLFVVAFAALVGGSSSSSG
jgi:uncharacterized membrane protein YjgN (DUF898 family)